MYVVSASSGACRPAVCCANATVVLRAWAAIRAKHEAQKIPDLAKASEFFSLITFVLQIAFGVT
jgi:hypothetical protein